MTITLSPIQPLRDYVTKKDFNEKFDGLKSYMDDGFDMTNKHIDNLEKKMDTKFALINKQFSEQKEDISNLTKIVNKIAAKIL